MSHLPLDADATQTQAHVSLREDEQNNTSTTVNARSLSSDDTNKSLQVPLDTSSRPDSPVNKKRTDDDHLDAFGRDCFLSHDNHHNHPFLPPSKKSKTSPLLQPQDDSTMTDVKDESLISHQRLESLVPDAHNNIVGARGQPPNSERRRSTAPTLVHSATAILDSLSKPGQNSLDNLHLSTPATRQDHIGERIMGVITSSTPKHESLGQDSGSSSPHTQLQISSDGHNHATEEKEEEGEPAEELAQEYGSYSDSYDSDSMDDIDVETHVMLDSDEESDGSPYEDPDPLCIDRFTEEETDEIIDEARMHGISFIIQKYFLSGQASAKKMLLLTIPAQIEIPGNVTENDVIRTMQQQLKRYLRRRKRLEHINSLNDVVDLLKSSKKIMVLTGAGVSVSCGIPDFRSEDGIYSRLSEFELDDPQQMFDLEFFRERPEIFYSFAREIFPSNFVPSPSHYFIKLLEDKGKLLRNYAQNIDALEQKAGIERVLQCHGSFATASCVRCGYQVKGDEIKESIFKQEVAYCTRCKPTTPVQKKKKAKARYDSDDEDDEDDDDDSLGALMKPDIVFFGEKLPPIFDQRLKEDKQEVDLLIVIGSSLKVAPVSDIMHQLPNSVPQILINRTPNYQMAFDVQLLGNCDTIVAELCRMAGWELKHEKLPGGTSNVPDMGTNTNSDGAGKEGRAAWSFMEPNIYLFEGALLEELDFEAVKEKSRNRGHDGKGEDSGGENEEDEEEDAAPTDDDDDEIEGTIPDDSSRRPLLVTGLGSDSSEDDRSDSGEEEEANGISALLSVDTAMNIPGVRPPIVGIASGTTQPRSGSIAEIHQTSDVSHIQSSMEDISALERQMHFTETMPRDIDEELSLSKNGDSPGQYLDPVLRHSRRPSADLVPITEDAQLEVDDSDEQDEKEIERTGAISGTSTRSERQSVE
ncbi:NAD-dependent histone deacetylase sir2 [Gryganskiella cystojenkinii]|nr:NAD-dependent histone deacetylase sir2 [Gryganskiella cystojenkinii]